MIYLDKIPKFDIVDKTGAVVPFVLNNVQEDLLNNSTDRNLVLKARQLGLSSLICAMFTLDFLGTENSRSVIISHDYGSATKLLDRTKYFIESIKNKGFDVSMKYNSRQEMVNSDLNSSIYIGVAGNRAFGRGDTIQNLLLDEFAFYPDPEAFLSGILQSVTPTGKVYIVSSPNGFNYFHDLWINSELGISAFKPHFYGRDFYPDDFLEKKKLELGRLFDQEYPPSVSAAFLSSGLSFFDKTALQKIWDGTREPMAQDDPRCIWNIK